jgi:hypothetical protein
VLLVVVVMANSSGVAIATRDAYLIGHILGTKKGQIIQNNL